MRRLLAVLALLVAAGAVAVVAVRAATGGERYQVRAIFDNAGFAIPGEDVKVAGVKVGTIASLDVTRQRKAAVVLDIADPAFQDFRQDAHCIVRPQSLIGERFVDCRLTRARAPGGRPAPPLRKVASGPGAGQYLLSVEHTSSPVDLDLIANIARRPVRERLSLILNELGTGVAGRGGDLAAVIRRADPALAEVDRLLRLLAGQNRRLARLAVDADAVLAPLARDRERLAGAIAGSGRVADAVASRRGDLEADLERLPRFLAELRPTMTRLGGLSDEMTPVLEDLDGVAPQVNRLILQLGPFSAAATPALRSLGEATRVGTPAVVAARPVVGDLRALAAVVRPVGGTAARVLTSLQRTRGVERLMDYLFFQATAINGFDAVGHYLRAGLIVNQCSTYATRPVAGCSANFAGASAARASAAAGAAAPRRTRVAPRRTRAAPRRTRAATPAPAAAPAASPARGRADAADDALLDYLFGTDG